MKTTDTNVRYIEEHTADNPDPRPGAYYVSVVDGRRYALALGPFTTHAAALEHVETVRQYCHDHDDRTRSWFYGYGTCRLQPEDPHPAGKLNRAPELAALLEVAA